MKNPIDRIYLFEYFLDFLLCFFLKATREKKKHNNVYWNQ